MLIKWHMIFAYIYIFKKIPFPSLQYQKLFGCPNKTSVIIYMEINPYNLNYIGEGAYLFPVLGICNPHCPQPNEFKLY